MGLAPGRAAIAAFVLVGLCGVATADTSIREVWICALKEGQTLDDVRAANSAWVKFVNANVKGGGISSDILTPMVGNVEEGRFVYADNFPSLESWTAARASTEGNEEGEAIDAALGEVATCPSNGLYTVEAS